MESLRRRAVQCCSALSAFVRILGDVIPVDSGSDGKESTYNAGGPGSIPGSGRSPGEGNGTPLQYSCLENPMDRGAWWATVHGVTKNWTLLSKQHTPHTQSRWWRSGARSGVGFRGREGEWGLSV